VLDVEVLLVVDVELVVDVAGLVVDIVGLESVGVGGAVELGLLEDDVHPAKVSIGATTSSGTIRKRRRARIATVKSEGTQAG